MVWPNPQFLRAQPAMARTTKRLLAFSMLGAPSAPGALGALGARGGPQARGSSGVGGGMFTAGGDDG